MNRIEHIRHEEKKYHEHCYDNYKLFEEGSWLHKPVKTVMDVMPHFEGKQNINVLDLGCGVGRNAIPIAQRVKEQEGKVFCVDLLASALSKLRRYSHEFGVTDSIQTQQADIGEYKIQPNFFDYIVAVSSLEHVKSEDALIEVLFSMAMGTKVDGTNCIIINTNVEEMDREMRDERPALLKSDCITFVVRNAQ